MQKQDTIHFIQREYQAFRDQIRSLSDEDFLNPMDGWTPRDVAAHLIGWNRHMIQASSLILAGKTPTYYADALNDYSAINAGFVQQYASSSKQEMLDELEVSFNELAAFLNALQPDEFTASHGVFHYRGHPATVAGTIASLAGDYREHARQIIEWFG